MGRLHVHRHHPLNGDVGILYGGFVELLPAVVTDDFGGKNVGGLIGIRCPSVNFGTLIGPRLAGFAFDLSDSYNLPIFASAMSSVETASIVTGPARLRITLHQKELR
jgi:MFS transporter, OFA family, oxalate/formate antiporter